MITNRIYEWARTQPAKTAMIHNDRRYSYAVFARAIGATLKYLKDQNLPAGRTAVVLISNLADAWVVMLGLRSIGLDTICVHSLTAAKALDVKNVACLVVTEVEKATHKLEEQVWVGARVIAVPKSIYASISTGEIPPPSNETRPLGGHILYTSGTTGSYKKLFIEGWIEERRNSYRANVESNDDNTVYFVANFSPWTSQGFNVPSRVWQTRGCVVFNQSPDSFLSSFRYGITRTFLTPPMLHSLLQLRDVSADPVGEFVLLVGGGFVPLDLAKRAVNRLTKNVTIYYGATEHSSTMRSSIRTSDDIHWLWPDVGSVFEIVDESGNECAINKEGELRVLLRDIDPTSYLDDHEASRKCFHEGYFYPGDMAVRRADGRVRILGRVADVLNMQGQKIAVAPVEQKLQDFLGVGTVCLFSFLNDDGKEELVVAIEADNAPPKFQLDKIDHLFKSFERVRFEVLQEFPRTEAGMQKIKRTELRKIIARKGARAGGGLN